MTASTFDHAQYQVATIVPGHPDVLFTQARTLRNAAQDVRTHSEVVRRNVPQTWRGAAAAAFTAAHTNELRRLEDWAARTDAVADVLQGFASVHSELQEQARQLTIRLSNLDTRLDNAGRIVNNSRGDIAADCSMEVVRARNDLDEARTQRVGLQMSCESLTAEFHRYAQRAAAVIDDIIGHARDPLPDFEGDARRAAFAAQFAEGYFGGGRALTPAEFGFTEAAMPSMYEWLRGEREDWGPDADKFWALYHDDSAIHVGDHRDRAHNHWDNYVDIIAAIAASLGPACVWREFVSQQTAAWHQGDEAANLIAAAVLVGLADPFAGLASAEGPMPSVEVAEPRIVVDPEKLDYLFGRVTSSDHNMQRSQQLYGEMRRLGLRDSPAGHGLVEEHLVEIASRTDNIVRLVNNEHASLEFRESFFAGPWGRFAKFETTWQLTSDGHLRFVTLIPFGGP